MVYAAEEKTWWNKPGFHLSYMEDYPPYPYQRIKSEDGKDTGVVALIAPFYDLTYYRVSCKPCLAAMKMATAPGQRECCRTYLAVMSHPSSTCRGGFKVHSQPRICGRHQS